MMPGTKPPPAIWTFLKVYGSEAAAPALVLPVTTCTATTTVAAHTSAAKALAILLRMKGSLKRGRRIADGATDPAARHRGPPVRHRDCTGVALHSRRRSPVDRFTYPEMGVNSLAYQLTSG